MLKGKRVNFLHSAVPSPYDRSMRFTLHPLADRLLTTPTRILWEAFSKASMTTRSICSFTYIHHSNVLIYTAERTSVETHSS